MERVDYRTQTHFSINVTVVVQSWVVSPSPELTLLRSSPDANCVTSGLEKSPVKKLHSIWIIFNEFSSGWKLFGNTFSKNLEGLIS